ncbi:uncharacterized protein LOC135205686 [Macrobrachium nipponense]|uniref:uncharacterized protein LOC135205686 n=1 Tax=Macrobrachium nipponense TaxID=159736 RepID=UPI0030C85900
MDPWKSWTPTTNQASYDRGKRNCDGVRWVKEAECPPSNEQSMERVPDNGRKQFKNVVLVASRYFEQLLKPMENEQVKVLYSENPISEKLKRLIEIHKKRYAMDTLWIIVSGIFTLVDSENYIMCSSCKHPLNFLKGRKSFDSVSFIDYASSVCVNTQKILGHGSEIIIVPPIPASVAVVENYSSHEELHSKTSEVCVPVTNCETYLNLKGSYNKFCHLWTQLACNQISHWFKNKPFESLRDSGYSSFRIFSSRQGLNTVLDKWYSAMQNFLSLALCPPQESESTTEGSYEKIVVLGSTTFTKKLQDLAYNMNVTFVDENVSLDDDGVIFLSKLECTHPGKTLWVILAGVSEVSELLDEGYPECNLFSCTRSLPAFVYKNHTLGDPAYKNMSYLEVVTAVIKQVNDFAVAATEVLSEDSCVFLAPITPLIAAWGGKGSFLGQEESSICHANSHRIFKQNPNIPLLCGDVEVWKQMTKELEGQWLKLLMDSLLTDKVLYDLMQKYVKMKPQVLKFVESESFDEADEIQDVWSVLMVNIFRYFLGVKKANKRKCVSSCIQEKTKLQAEPLRKDHEDKADKNHWLLDERGIHSPMTTPSVFDEFSVQSLKDIHSFNNQMQQFLTPSVAPSVIPLSLNTPFLGSVSNAGPHMTYSFPPPVQSFPLPPPPVPVQSLLPPVQSYPLPPPPLPAPVLPPLPVPAPLPLPAPAPVPAPAPAPLPVPAPVPFSSLQLQHSASLSVTSYSTLPSRIPPPAPMAVPSLPSHSVCSVTSLSQPAPSPAQSPASSSKQLTAPDKISEDSRDVIQALYKQDPDTQGVTVIIEHTATRMNHTEAENILKGFGELENNSLRWYQRQKSQDDFIVVNYKYRKDAEQAKQLLNILKSFGPKSKAKLVTEDEEKSTVKGGWREEFSHFSENSAVKEGLKEEVLHSSEKSTREYKSSHNKRKERSARRVSRDSFGYELHKRKKTPSKEEAEYKLAKRELNIEHDRDFELYLQTPEIHPEYDCQYVLFREQYQQKYPGELDEEKYMNLWKTFWKVVVTEMLKDEYDEKRKVLDIEYKLHCDKTSKEHVKHKSSRKRDDFQKEKDCKRALTHNEDGKILTKSVTPDGDEEFFVDKTLRLLTEVSPALGILEPMFIQLKKEIEHCQCDRAKLCKLFEDEERKLILKRISEKAKKLSEITKDSGSEKYVVKLQLASVQALKLVEYATSGSKKQGSEKQSYYGIDIESVAKATYNKTNADIIQSIKDLLAVKGIRDIQDDDLSSIYDAVVLAHMKLACMK